MAEGTFPNKMGAELNSRIGDVLSDWNPIGVPKELAFSEYAQYIEEIKRHGQSKEDLISYLENLLLNRLGLDYDPSNEAHKADVVEVSLKILAIVSDTTV